MIAICGASGYIGRHLLSYLRKRRVGVLGTYNSSRMMEGNTIRFDMRTDSHELFRDMDFVVIAAAYVKIKWCEENKIEAYWLNVYHTKRLLDSLDNWGIPALFISSDAAGRGDTTYGKYKRQVEKYIDQNDLNAKYIRPGKINDDNIEDLCREIYAHIKSGCRQKAAA